MLHIYLYSIFNVGVCVCVKIQNLLCTLYE